MKIFLGVPCASGTMQIETVRSIVGLEGITNVAFVSNALIHDARHQIVKEFLKSDCEYLMFLDDDMVVQPDTAIRLVEVAEKHNKDLVTAMIFRRVEPYTPCFYAESDGRLLPYGEWKDNTLIPIVACGLAACVISRKALEPFETHNPFIPKGLGEDMSFCARLRENGCTLSCHTGIDTGHMQRRPISSRHWKEYYESHKEEK